MVDIIDKSSVMLYQPELQSLAKGSIWGLNIGCYICYSQMAISPGVCNCQVWLCVCVWGCVCVCGCVCVSACVCRCVCSIDVFDCMYVEESWPEHHIFPDCSRDAREPNWSRQWPLLLWLHRQCHGKLQGKLDIKHLIFPLSCLPPPPSTASYPLLPPCFFIAYLRCVPWSLHLI